MLKETQIENLENELWDYIKEDVAPLISKLQSCSEENLDEPHAHSVPVVTRLDGFAKEVLKCATNMNIHEVVIYVAGIRTHVHEINSREILVLMIMNKNKSHYF